MDVETRNKPAVGVKAWLGAMRLRTLPLAISATSTGAVLALQQGQFSKVIFLLTLLTTLLLQITSNLANDYGDFSRGTDNDQRIGPARAMQSGAISKPAMKLAIWVGCLLSFVAGVSLLWLAHISTFSKLILLVIGVSAIYASVTYTAGKNPYGYRALGDLSVLLFFGIVGVCGAYFLQTSSFQLWVLFPALSIGLLSAAVLNINNLRDIENDAASGKITLAVKMGQGNGRLYHLTLLCLAVLFLMLYGWSHFTKSLEWLFLLALPLIALNGWKVYRIRIPQQLDPWLKQLALTTFLMVLLLSIGVVFTR